MGRDIQDNDDIKLIVDTFYQAAFNDAKIGFIFQNHMSKTLEEHKPTIYRFWESVLFSNGQYRGNPMKTHIQLNKKVKLTPAHFEHWIGLWNATVDRLYFGDKAEEAKSKALLMKDLMLFKIRQSEQGNFIQ